MPSAIVIVIGDELLRGKVRDENAPWLIDRLAELGVDLLAIHTLPDDTTVIARCVRAASATARHVLTTGGVGPTHDDLTMEGVALAFDVPLVVHPQLDALLAGKLGDRYNDAARRMATVPDGAELLWDGDVFFPQVRMRNVLVFPGVPRLLRRKFDAVAERLGGVPRANAALLSSELETTIAARLSAVAAHYPQVAIGSYPQIAERTVKILLDSRDRDALRAAFAALEQALEGGLLRVTPPT